MACELELDPEQEALRVRIDESRDALTQKIEQLEEKVTETVETATAKVVEATEAVTETVQSATASVSETVDTVTGAVQGTVDCVRESVEGAVDSIKDTFNLNRMVELHPWLMVAGSVGVGYLAGQALSQKSSEQGLPTKSHLQVNNGAGAYEPPNDPESSHPGMMQDVATNGSAVDIPQMETFQQPAQTKLQPGLLSSLADSLGPEISTLRGLAIGIGFSSLKDLLLKSTPEVLQQPVASMIDGLTQRWGGECLRGSLFTPGSGHTGDRQSTTTGRSA